MATQGIDFSDLGGKQVQPTPAAGSVDFSDLGGKLVSPPTTTLQQNSQAQGQGMSDADIAEIRAVNEARPWWQKILGISPDESAFSPAMRDKMAAKKEEDKQAIAGMIKDEWANGEFSPEIGAIKGVGSTLHTAAHYVTSGLDKVGLLPGSNGLSKLITGENPNVVPLEEPDDLKAEGFGQHVGMGLENVLEFMAGDEALKGLSVAEKLKQLAPVAAMLEKYPRLANILGTAIRQGAVGTAQGLAHGETPGDAVESGAVTGAISAGAGGLGELGSSIKKTLSENVAKEGAELAESLAGGSIPSQPELVGGISDKIDAAEEAMHTKYDAGMANVSQAAQDVPVKVPDSPLQKTAADLLSDSKVPDEIQKTLKGIVPDKAKIQPILEELATSPKSYSWDEMEGMRQSIGKSIRDVPFDSPIKGDLIQLRSAIDETMQKAAADAGKPQLADQIQALRDEYAQTSKQLTEQSIKTLRGKNPDAIADVLLNKSSVHNVSNLRDLIGPQNMKAVEGGIFDRMLDRSVGPDGEFNPKALKRIFYGMKPDTVQAIWGDRVADVKSFIDKAANSPLAKIKNAATAAKWIGAGVGAWRIATSDDPLSTARNELVIGLSGLGALHIAPKMLSNPAVLKTVGNVMQFAGKPGTRKAAAVAANQLMMAVQAANAQDNIR